MRPKQGLVAVALIAVATVLALMWPRSPEREAAAVGERAPSAFEEAEQAALDPPERSPVEQATVGEARAAAEVGSDVEPGTSVEGTVHRTGTGLSGVVVRLVRPAAVRDSNESFLVPASADVERRPGPYRHEIDSTVTDAAGRFRFESEEAGTFLVVAQVGAFRGSTAPFTLRSGEHGTVELELPAMGRIVGRVLTPPGSSLEGFRLWVRSAETELRPTWQTAREHMAEVRADGAFGLGPLPAGESTLLLYLPVSLMQFVSTPSEAMTPALELEEVVIPAGGVLQHDISLEHLPCARVVVTSWGAPLPGVDVLFSPQATYLSLSRTRRSFGKTDAAGRAPPVLLLGQTWTVDVENPEQGWRHPHPEPIRASRDEPTIRIEVQPVEGALSLVDGGNATPLAGRPVSIWPWGRAFRGRSRLVIERETDDEGRLILTLTPGEYRIEVGERKAIFRWTATGPASAELDL